MNSIAKAINNVAIAIQAVATAITGSNKIQTKTVTTSNPVSTTVTVKPVETLPNISTPKTNPYTQPKQNYYSSYKISLNEKNAIDAIYLALVDKGNHPDHHDHIMREISIKWPVLYKALDQLIIARKQKHLENDYHNYQKSYADIWKSGTKDKW